MLQYLSRHIFVRYTQLGAIQDLQRAMQVIRGAISKMTGEHPLLGLVLSDMGRCLSARFDTLGALEDITSAVRVSEKAVHLTAVDHVDRAEMFFEVMR